MIKFLVIANIQRIILVIIIIDVSVVVVLVVGKTSHICTRMYMDNRLMMRVRFAQAKLCLYHLIMQLCSVLSVLDNVYLIEILQNEVIILTYARQS